MLRRLAPTKAMVARSGAVTTPARQLTTPSLILSSLSCYLSMLCWGSWFNNYANVRKYGRWRFRNTIDDNVVISDFKTYRYAGCLFGIFFWATLVGPRRYNRKNSSLEQHPGWVRYGPL